MHVLLLRGTREMVGPPTGAPTTSAAPRSAFSWLRISSPLRSPTPQWTPTANSTGDAQRRTLPRLSSFVRGSGGVFLQQHKLHNRTAAMAVAAESVKEVLPPTVDPTSDPPPLFDGTTRLYMSYVCPYAQRTWIARNYKGLQEKIKLVPLDLQNRPPWYKEKVCPTNKVPSLEHNNEVKAESLDLLKYIGTHFEGPTMLPDDPAKKDFAEELLSYSDTFVSASFKPFTSNASVEEETAPVYDKLEDALSKFDDGPFFLGLFSLVDIAYAPFIQRFQPLFAEGKNYDITKGRPKLALWIEELNKVEAYKQTVRDPQEILGALKRRFGIN